MKKPWTERVEVVREFRFLEIRIDGIQHMALEWERCAGFQSWEDGYPASGFVIEFYLTGMEPFQARYDLRVLWQTIIQKLTDCLQGGRRPSPKQVKRET